MQELNDNILEDTINPIDNEKIQIQEASEIPEELKNSLEVPQDTPNESVDIKNEEANTTNCLALTIQKEHKIVALKNVFLRSIRMSWKVAVSAITLALIKLFS